MKRVLAAIICISISAFVYQHTAFGSENSIPPLCGKHSVRGKCGRCGWTQRQYFGVTDPAANLASWWFHYGSPASGPCIGCLAVSYGHVARIVGQEGNFWIFADDRGIHPMSLNWIKEYRQP